MKPTLASVGRASLIGLLALSVQVTPALAKDRLEEKFIKTYPLNSDGQVRLDNVNGKIHISTWDRPEVQVDALKRADNQQDLDATKIEIDSKSDRIAIHTKYPKKTARLWGKSNETSVEYSLKVPAGARLEDIETVNGSIEIVGVHGAVNASTVNGRLAARGLAGDTRLETVNGTLEAAFDKLDGVKSISMEAVNGRLDLTLPANANAEVEAESVNGRIEADKLTTKKNWPVGNELRGTLGNGGTRVKAETVNGGIRVKLAGPAERQLAEEPEKS